MRAPPCFRIDNYAINLVRGGENWLRTWNIFIEKLRNRQKTMTVTAVERLD
jgi:hypothetical protein